MKKYKLKHIYNQFDLVETIDDEIFVGLKHLCKCILGVSSVVVVTVENKP